ncbi:MAG: ATP-binding cassette domain-containing protein [Bifidobacteriaceae bacterium]|jgi:ABC-2 type transport system ATP-binding protein|nr:ATP-binding cassette domain-containing protein [Bifidobacteriaceae bacterium]
MGESDDAVRIVGAVKTYRRGARPALDGLDLEVRRGEIFGFLGPNGAGKTTAMRVIMGLASLDQGDVRVLGFPPGSSGALTASGALIETPALYPAMTGAGHLGTVARWRGVSAASIPELLEMVGLGGAGNKKTKAYSLGMKQRLGVATALLGDPELVVLDEPANGLDPEGMRHMRDLLTRLRDAGRTVLLSSHLLGEVEQVADRVGVVAQGRMAKVAPPHELGGGVLTAVFRVRPADQAVRALAASGLVAAKAIRLEGAVDNGPARADKGEDRGGGRSAILGQTLGQALSGGSLVYDGGAGPSGTAPFSAGQTTLGAVGDSGHDGGRGTGGDAAGIVPREGDGRGTVTVELDGGAAPPGPAEETVARLVAALVAAGVAVMGAELRHPDLTAAFLALTGGADGAGGAVNAELTGESRGDK